MTIQQSAEAVVAVPDTVEWIEKQPKHGGRVFRIDRDGDRADWRVVDESRDVEMRERPWGEVRELYFAFLLTSRGRGVPFLGMWTPGEMRASRLLTRAGEWKIEPNTFGHHIVSDEFDTDPAYKFASSAERSELLLLAAEALLVYGRFFDGLDAPDGFFRVTAEVDGSDKTFKLSDFGYHSPQ